jgi:hypothetical protein
MGNTIREFDLHMEVGEEWYCGDPSVTCEVTYPSLTDQPAIKVDYDTGDDSLGKAVARAITDIQAYMIDPHQWIEDYINHSSEDWRKLKAAEKYVEEYRTKIADANKNIAWYQEYLAKHEANVAALQAKLKSEEKQD